MSAVNANAAPRAAKSLKREYYEALRQLTLELAGIHLGRDHTFLVETRLAGLARAEGFPSLADMVDELFATGHNRLAVRVVSALLERASRFFDDPGSLDLFERRVLPEAAHDAGGRPVRVLSFGCASGQEVWSLAMIGHRVQRSRPHVQVQVTGVDYPSAALERGRAGLYTHFEVQRGLPVVELLSHFRPHTSAGGPAGSDDWIVREHLRETVSFEDVHLLSRLDPLGEFDVVMFRGQIGRYSGPAQVRVLRGVAGLVREGGTLLLGTGEALARDTYGFDADPVHPNLLHRRARTPVIPEPEPEVPRRTRFGPQS